jgi:hypothetical protein
MNDKDRSMANIAGFCIMAFFVLLLASLQFEPYQSPEEIRHDSLITAIDSLENQIIIANAKIKILKGLR